MAITLKQLADAFHLQKKLELQIKLEKKRKLNRERQRRYRAKQKEVRNGKKTKCSSSS